MLVKALTVNKELCETCREINLYFIDNLKKIIQQNLNILAAGLFKYL